MRPPCAATIVAKGLQDSGENRRLLLRRRSEQADHATFIWIVEDLNYLFDYRRLLDRSEHDGVAQTLIVAFGIDDARLVTLLHELRQDRQRELRLAAGRFACH